MLKYRRGVICIYLSYQITKSLEATSCKRFFMIGVYDGLDSKLFADFRSNCDIKSME